MPTVVVPAWFDLDTFSAQKAAQMNVTNYGADWLTANADGATSWTAALFQQYLMDASWNGVIAGDTAAERAYTNFEYTNMVGTYDGVTGMTEATANASPNPMFNIPVFLQGLANQANASATETGAQTVQTELDTIFQGGDSAWGYYDANWATMLDVNPSNAFDTQKYLQARADLMGDNADVAAAVKAIQDAGLNPVQDYYVNGTTLGITADAIAVTAGSEVTPADASWNPWGEGGSTPTDDPYDNVQATVDLVKGDAGPYTGEAGANTLFDANWTDAANSTLAASDVITGGANAYNTLQVEFGKDWSGFNGVTPEDETQFENNDSVTNIGRIVLNHATDNRSEHSYTWDAQYISDDTVRYDLVGSGTGAINLSNLSAAVQEINISNINAVSSGNTQPATSIEFDSSAFTGKNDSLTLGFENVCSDGNTHPVTGISGVENLNVVSSGTTTNNVSLDSIMGVKNLTVTGNAYLNIATPEGVKAFDASGTTAGVNFAVPTLTNQTVTGGSGTDTVSFNGDAPTASAANWSNIEAVAFNETGSVTLNAKGYTGLEQVNINNDGLNTIKNLTADDLQVFQTVATTSLTTINGTKQGSLNNIAWVSEGGSDGKQFTANFESNAAGDATIRLTGNDSLKGTTSSFNFTNADGTVTLINPNAAADNTSLKLTAEEATALTITSTGALKIDAVSANDDLANVENVTLNLTADGENDLFEMTANLASAETVSVNAGDESVTLKDLGSIAKDGNAGLTLQVKDAVDFVAGKLQSSLSGDIVVSVTADGDITLGDIETSTNKSSNDQGDISVNLSGESLTGMTNVKGGAIRINLSNIETGDITTALDSTESISYTGLDGDGTTDGTDTITIKQIGAGSSSSIRTGDGEDIVTIDATLSSNGGWSSSTKTATINVNLGDDSADDILTLTGATGKGFVRVNVVGGEGDKITGAVATDAVSAACKAFGISTESLPDGAADNGYWQNGNTCYAVIGTADSGLLVTFAADSGIDASALGFEAPA